MALTRVLITVKTYPTLSDKYDELVCTAGFREDGSWVRIYPVPFRKKPYEEQYKKYDWIEVDLVKNDRDFRPESYRPRSEDSEISIVGHIDTSDNWRERKKICLSRVCYNLTELIGEAKDEDKCTSLAVFKPTSILDFTIEPIDREWDADKLAKLNQLNLFETNTAGRFQVVKKLPYKFSYVIRDNDGRESRMMIEDWEIGQLYWNCLSRHHGDERKAITDVKSKYFDKFSTKHDLYLFIGTTREFHHIAPNPFIIIGTFYPMLESQLELF